VGGQPFRRMKVSVFGLGYVGSVTAACLAKFGHSVIGIDPQETKVRLINSGKSPVVEPRLGELIGEVVKAGRLRAVTNAEELGDVSLICVGTPGNRDGSIDLRQVLRVATQIGESLRAAAGFHVVTIRSSVLPGTVEELILPAIEQASGKPAAEFGICMHPEFMREATAIHDYHNPPLTVIGAQNEKSAARVADLYAGLGFRIERTTIKEAEMIKYACNAFHAAKVCFANEIGNFSKKMGIDSHRVMTVLCQDTKLNLSPQYLQPGFAFGGSCLPKDLRAVIHRAKESDLDLPMIESLLASNRRQITEAFELVRATGKNRIGILGLSFKPGSDDLRESPTVELVRTLVAKGFNVTIYDEDVTVAELIGANREYIDQALPELSSLMCPSLDKVIAESEVVVVTRKAPQLAKALEQHAASKKIIDLVRLFPHASGGNYQGICW
jgi:GDP-mannose 6-dehydrogenase